MKLFWQDGQGQGKNESFLLVYPAAKLASIEYRDGVFWFKCLNQYVPLRVETFELAKRLAEVRLLSVLRELLETLSLGAVGNEDVPNGGSARKR